MQIRSRIKTTRPISPFESNLEQELHTYTGELARVINKGIKFEDNFNAYIGTTSDTGAADTEFTVTHSLGRVPSGFIVINNNKAGIVYDSGTAWTASVIYLKCNVANCTVKLIVT